MVDLVSTVLKGPPADALQINYLVIYTMKIEDEYELLALHRCIFEAKFNADPEDSDIVGSPFAAKLANDVVKELEEVQGKSWSEWRVAENHQTRIEALISALQKQHTNLSSVEEKREYVLNALAPLRAKENTVNEIIRAVYESPE